MGTRLSFIRDSARVAHLKKWIKRGGIGLFLFFFLKGIAWLILPGLLVYFCSR